MQPGEWREEDALVRRAAARDVDAYAALVRRHQAAAVRLAHVICGAADADDAAQEAFVKAYAALDRFRPGTPFRPWLLRIVANEARNRRRAAGRRTHYELRVASLPPPARTGESPEAAALAAEERAALAAGVARLPDRSRDVLACRYLLGLSEAETAGVLGLPAGTVKSRLSRALDQLRAELTGTGPARTIGGGGAR